MYYIIKATDSEDKVYYFAHFNGRNPLGVTMNENSYSVCVNVMDQLAELDGIEVVIMPF